MEQTDNELAALASGGDQQAWSMLFQRYQQPIYNFAYRMVDNAEDAADIVQNSFIKVFQALESTEVANFSAYLYRTARNLSYDEIRRRRRFAHVDEEMLAPEDPNIYSDPQKAMLLQQQIDGVRRAVSSLNENYRSLLILRELQDLNYDEIADIVGSNRSAVGTALSRARLRFREELRMAQLPLEQIPPECEDIIAQLSPYMDGELKSDENETVEAHLLQCPFCMAALEEMREASSSMRMLIPVLPRTDVAEAATRALQESVSHDSWAEDQGSWTHGGRAGQLRRLAKNRAFLSMIGVVAALIAASTLFAESVEDDNISGTTSPAFPQQEEKRIETIPRQISWQNCADVPAGETTVMQEGADGSKEVVYQVTYMDGSETTRTIIGETVISLPVSKINCLGTGPATPGNTLPAPVSTRRETTVPSPNVLQLEETVLETIPRNEVWEYCPGIPEGEIVVMQEGKDGTKEIIYIVTYTDGVETARSVKTETVLEEPIPKAICEGIEPTSPPPEY